jgi:NAD dependent epimerase/dehydratase family enzyme
VQVQEWDGCTASGWGHWLNDDSAIINLAGAYPISWLWSPEQAEQVLESRLSAAAAIAEAIHHAPVPPRLLLQASSVDYYGDCGDDLVIEASPPGDGWRARLVTEWEQATAEIPVRQHWLRFGMVLDRQRTILPDGQGAADHWVSWIHADDVARAIRFLLEYEGYGPVNLVAPQPVTADCFRRALKGMGGRRAKQVTQDAAIFMPDSQRVLPEKLTAAGFHFTLGDLEDALRMLFL